jgi:peptide/nickel transport system substrate-binding protein
MSRELREILPGKSMGRRSVIRGSLLGGAGLAAAALLGCGGDEADEPAATTSTQATAAAATGPGKLVQDPKLPFPYNFPEPATVPKPGGTMVVAASWDVGPMDPTVSASGGTVTVPNMVYNRLLGFKRGPDTDVFKEELTPELAASWERSPDGMTFTFKMQPGVKWQNLPPLNGRPFTASDAAHALNRYKTTGVHQSYYVNVDTIAAVDDATLKVTMKRPVADFLYPLGSNKQTLPPKELVDSGEIVKKVIGTGPMILKEATAAQRVTFDKNPDYWEKKVLLDGFEFRIMPDATSRLAAFRAGQVDYAYSVVSSLSDVKALQGTNPKTQINMLPSILGYGFAMNLANPKFQDERIRQGLSLAINRDAIIQIVFETYGRTADIIPWTYVFDNEPTAAELGPWVHYDPKEARKLLDAAGASNLSLANTYYAYSETNNRWTEVLVSQFKDIGVTVTGGKADYTEFNSQWIGRKLPEVSTYGWATSGFDADNWFHGQIHSKSPGNRWNINDAQLDQWAETQQTELDPAKRRAIWRKIWDRELAQAYRPPMATGFTFETYQPWMRGIRWSGTSPGDNSSYYNWGDQVQNGWLDK